MIDKFLRVDHAGEFGADKIYAGQLAVLGPKGVGPLPFMPDVGGRKVSAEETGQLIQHMWDQEKEHLAAFEMLIPKHRARPTGNVQFWFMKKLVKLCLHLDYIVQNSFHFDEIFEINFKLPI